MPPRVLNNAKNAKNDEFYTLLCDIRNEVTQYLPQFRDKVIFCNCDDPFESNFFKFFALCFEAFGLKKLITTSYQGSKISDGKAYKIIMDNYIGDVNHDGRYDLDDVEDWLTIEKQKMQAGDPNAKIQVIENGDFASPECIELMKEADIVCTNPPFSLFRKFISTLMQYKKKFLIIGNMNAICCKEIFPHIKENNMWLGYTWPKQFINPETNEFQQFGNICWFTNLEVTKQHEFLDLYENYSPEKNPKYDNYDAIEVSQCRKIPCDYDGIMGVPITFIDKYCPEQFEILSIACGNSQANYLDTILKLGYDLSVKSRGGNAVLNGKNVYSRLLIRKRK